jgi:Zn-dependent protease/predicted transcriptional regulator
MKSQIKLGTVFGVELGLHYSWFVIALLIAFSLAAHFSAVNRDWSGVVVWGAAIVTAVLFFAGLFAHELSHALVARARGLPIHKITLFLLGGVAHLEREAADATTEFWVGIVGPITSFVLGFLLLGAAAAFGWSFGSEAATPGIAVLVWLGYINVLLAVFNMIPGFPLDGGRVFRAVVWWLTGDGDRATRIAARVGQLVAAGFIAWGILRVFSGMVVGGIWIAFIGWFLLQASSASYAHLMSGALLRGLKVRDLMSQGYPAVEGGLSLLEVIHDHLMRTGQRFFVVTEGGNPVGLITSHEIRGTGAESWPTVRAREVMRPLDQVHTVAPEISAMEALETMVREDVNQLLVRSAGGVEGIVARAHILQVLQVRAELQKGRSPASGG